MTPADRPRARPPERLDGDGLVLRPWDEGDLATMIGLFDDPDVARYTPLATPFDATAAREYLVGARRDGATGRRVRLAITRDGGEALGEVLLIRDDEDPTAADLGYMVGPAHRGGGLARRALRLMTVWAHAELGLATLRLRIQPGNEASNVVARRGGYAPVPGPPATAVLHERSVSLRIWVHRAGPGRGASVVRDPGGEEPGGMTPHDLPGGTSTLGDLTVTRVGYGAMQLAGPGVFGPPRDPDAARAVLREVVDLGINHIDTSDFYGPHVTNELIRETLAPYPDDLHLVTKVGNLRDDTGGWPLARRPEELRAAVGDNLRRLGLDVLDVVNLRVGGTAEDSSRPVEGSIAEPFGALAEMQREGLVRHLGISTATPAQVAEARSIAEIVCVQNMYNLVHRGDDALIDALRADGIAYVPYFPLGGFSPLQSGELDAIAKRLDATSMGVALAWLLHRSPNILLIPGTSSVGHLRENVAGAGLALDDDVLAELDRIGA